MPIEKQQELIRLVETMAMRVQVCENLTDKALMIQALGHLIDYQACVSGGKK